MTIAAQLFSFKGRMRRGTFWKWWLILFPLNLLNTAVMASATSPLIFYLSVAVWGIMLLWIVPAMWAKRLHDIGASAWMILTFLVPLWNIVTAISILFFPSEDGTNRFGPHPLASGPDDDTPQIAGVPCHACGENIMTANDGAFCRACRAVFHSGCARDGLCPRCKQVIAIHGTTSA